MCVSLKSVSITKPYTEGNMITVATVTALLDVNVKNVSYLLYSVSSIMLYDLFSAFSVHPIFQEPQNRVCNSSLLHVNLTAAL